MTPTVLYRTADLLVRHVPAADNTRHAVTFDCYHDDRTLDRLGFGEEYFARHGIPATHLLSRDNDWFQYPDLPAALEAMRAAASDAGRVLAYGSSMGAYAAVRFADAVGATAALALSPQYSVDPAKAPFERRWGQDQRRLRFLPALDGPIRSHVRPVIAYDPSSTDRLHADLIARDTPVQRLRLPFAGHPVGSFLHDAGLLHRLVMETLDGTLDAAGFERDTRAARRGSAQFYGILAARQPSSRHKCAVGLAQRAVTLDPARPGSHHALALCLSAAGRHAEALAAHERVAALERHPGYMMDHLDALRLAGDTAVALAVAHGIRAAWPHHAGIHNTIAELLRAQRDVRGALGFAEQAMALDPGSAHYRRTVAVLRAKLHPLAPHLATRALFLCARKALGGR